MYCFWWPWLRRAPPRPIEMASELSAFGQLLGSKNSCRSAKLRFRMRMEVRKVCVDSMLMHDPDKCGLDIMWIRCICKVNVPSA